MTAPTLTTGGVWDEVRARAAEDGIVGDDRTALSYVATELILEMRLDMRCRGAFETLFTTWNGTLDELVAEANRAPAGFLPDGAEVPF